MSDLTLEFAQQVLQHAQPNEVCLIRLPNGHLRIDVQTVTSPTIQGKWAKFAEHLQQESLLHGRSSQLAQLIQQFRQEFTSKEP
jgi:hypothetical protein